MAIEEFKKHIQEIIAKAQRLCAAKTHEGAGRRSIMPVFFLKALGNIKNQSVWPADWVRLCKIRKWGQFSILLRLQLRRVIWSC